MADIDFYAVSKGSWAVPQLEQVRVSYVLETGLEGGRGEGLVCFRSRPVVSYSAGILFGGDKPRRWRESRCINHSRVTVDGKNFGNITARRPKHGEPNDGVTK